MALVRPTNINKREYPGNASLIGRTRTATLGISTTTCCSSTPSFGACVSSAPLGCTSSCCHCTCCSVCCSCNCTVCTQNVPSGMWKISEQYEAASRSSWGSSSTSSSSAATCLCCTNVGFACTGSIVNFGGNHICSSGGVRWIASPPSSEVIRTWYARNDAATRAQQDSGCTGWFIPSVTQLQNPAFVCRNNWERLEMFGCYWSNTESSANRAFAVYFFHGPAQALYKVTCGPTTPARAFRCVTY